MRHLLRFPKLISRSRFQGRSTIPPPTHRFPLPPSHLTRTFSPLPKLCPYWNCGINKIGKISVKRMEKLLNVDARMKMQDLKLRDFNRRLDEGKSKSTGEIIKDLTLGKARSILFDYLLGNWYTFLAYLASLLGLVELVKKIHANLQDLRKEVDTFIKETVKHLNELDGKIKEIITTLNDFQARVVELEKELKKSTSGGRNATPGGAAMPGA